jgi:hypothetical protein
MPVEVWITDGGVSGSRHKRGKQFVPCHGTTSSRLRAAFSLSAIFKVPMSEFGTRQTLSTLLTMSAHEGIVLQKSKVAAVQIFGENLKRKEVDDSHSLSRATEVAHEFGARR